MFSYRYFHTADVEVHSHSRLAAKSNRKNNFTELYLQTYLYMSLIEILSLSLVWHINMIQTSYSVKKQVSIQFIALNY